MTKSRTIEITIETHEVTQIRRTGGRPVRCVVCGAEDTGYSVENAKSKTEADEIELAQLLETGLIHSTGNKGRVLDICGTSLTDATEE